MKDLPEYFPRADRRRDYYKDNHVEITCLAECVEGVWRARFKYTLIVGRRQFSDSGVNVSTTYATAEDAIKQAHIDCLSKMKVLFTWSDKSLKELKAELRTFAETCRRYGISLKNSKIWEA